jgi:hypothetical protein
MHSSLTNLLPSERLASLASSYYLRLGTLVALLVAALVIINSILLTPTFIYLYGEIELRDAELAELSRERAASGYEDLAARVATLSMRASALLELETVPKGSDAIRAILDLSHTGITLSSFAFSPSRDGGSMALIGTAATRESLRDFDSALGGLPFVKATNLPLSAYAKERDISFSITLTLMPAL